VLMRAEKQKLLHVDVVCFSAKGSVVQRFKV